MNNLSSNKTEYLDAIFNSDSSIYRTDNLNQSQINKLKSMNEQFDPNSIDIYLLNLCFKKFYNKPSTKQSIN